MSLDAQPHLAIDLRIVDAPGMELTGVGRYALEVARGLRAARPGWRLTVYSNRPDLLRLEGPTEIRPTRWPTSSSIGRVAWLHAGVAVSASRAPDLWFGPAFVLPLWWRRPAVVTVHDLVFQLMPERYRGRLNAAYARRATAWSARRAERVLCGSEETKARLVEHLGLEPGRVAVIPYGVSGAFFEAHDEPSPAPEPRSGGFLLFVGTFEPRKGLDVLDRALRLLDRRVRLVLAGRPGWGGEQTLERLRRVAEVEIVEAPSDAALVQLYRRALALVYPSYMEGFGLPVAEAMAAGCPVLASDLGCIREFAGDVPLYARPGDAEGLARGIELLIEEAGRRDEMVRAGRRAVAGLDWSSVGERTAAEIEPLLARAQRRADRASS